MWTDTRNWNVNLPLATAAGIEIATWETKEEEISRSAVSYLAQQLSLSRTNHNQAVSYLSRMRY